MNDRFKFRLPFYDNKGTFTHFQYFDIINGLEAYNAGVMYHNGEYEQCTGLKDKNGNLIYEGDLVCDRGEIEPVCNMPMVVKWSDRLCGFIFDNEKIGMRTDVSSIDSAESHNYEIIGNIHNQKEQQ